MDKKKATYVLYGLWGLAIAFLAWFIVDLHIHALIGICLSVAAALAWWGTTLTVTKRMRTIAVGSLSGFWTVIAVFMFFPFPPPDAPEYIVGEVHRFSEMNHGFGRGYSGVLGPQLLNHGYTYTSKELIEPLAKARGGAAPAFTTTMPLSRALFGGTVLTDGLRAPDVVGGEPVKVIPYPWTTFEGPARSTKLGWNQGDLLLGDVAKKVGYAKAKYTPEENALMVKAIAKFMGSVDVGVCRVDPRWFYSHDFMTAGTPLPLEDVKELKFGIQVFADQDWTRVSNDPGESWWSITKSGVAYSNSAWIASRLAQTLRDMGYVARVGHGGLNYETIETPFSVYNGLGEYGRLSDAVVPSVGGLRFKSATILTDFPMQPDPERKSFGVTRFCSYCDRCARACPVNAIPLGEPTVENGILMWHVDKDKCVRFRMGNLNGNCCNECLKACPYNKPATLFHLLGNYMVKHSPLAPRLFGSVGGVGLEDWLEYDYAISEEFGINRPARWILENPGYKTEFPRLIGKYIATEDDRSPVEEWATGIGAEMGKVKLSYRGVVFGEIPSRYLDANGRNRNMHWDYPEGELSPDAPNRGKLLTPEEARAMLEAGEAFSGGWYKKDEDVYPRRSEKYEKGILPYSQAAEMWAKE